MNKLIIIGGRTGALEVKGIVDDINRAAPTYEIAGVLDDDPLIQGGTVGGMPVLGCLDKAGSFAGAGISCPRFWMTIPGTSSAGALDHHGRLGCL